VPVDHRCHVRVVLLGFARVCLIGATAGAHDISNQRMDQSIQVRLQPALMEIDYEVSRSELTLAQDLRSLMGGLPGGIVRHGWLFTAR
jgi:hypothetical protein